MSSLPIGQQHLRARGQDPSQFGFGRAQPIQPQSQGTPYGSPTTPPPTGMVYNRAPSSQPANFSAYRPQPAQQASSNPFTQYNPQQMGNVFQQQSGLPSFQFSATDSFGNTYNNPAALTAQQGAMAQALNAQRAQQIQSGQRAPLNPQAAYQQAQQMIQGGWTNPFAQPDSQQVGTMGGPATDPRWSHNGGQWRSGQAQPIQPPGQGLPYGYAPDQHVDWRLPDADGRGGYGPGDPRTGDPSLPPPTTGGPFPPKPSRNQGWGGMPEYNLAQPVQPPSQGTPYGQPSGGRGQIAGAAKPPTYADELRARDQAKYDELMQQIRLAGGVSTRAQDFRKSDLERRLRIGQLASGATKQNDTKERRK